MTVQFPYRPLEIALMKVGGTSLLDIDLNGNIVPSLAREVQRDAIKGTILHVDFVAVDMNTKIRADIPISLIGTSPAVVARKGVLLTGNNTVTVEAYPRDLRDSVEVDLSSLIEVGDGINVKDLYLGEDVDVLNDPEEIVAKIVQTSAARRDELEAMDDELAGESAEVEDTEEDESEDE
jgi:large subunit ribosomal protein L25